MDHATKQQFPHNYLSLPQGLWPERILRQALRHGTITGLDLVPWGSNGTFLVQIDHAPFPPLLAIYKPARGETPLWDFPAGTLYKREYASYLLSRLLRWFFIPPTVIRHGPYGIGTVQLYIEPADCPVRSPRFRTELQRIVLFDLITNNADRKASHFFVGQYDRRLWGIDHGLTFHVDPKLRTVIWDFCGQPIPSAFLSDLQRLLQHQRRVERLLGFLLHRSELERFWHRLRSLLNNPVFPLFHPRRNLPFGW